MKKILIITYHFPPDGAIGGRRPFRFARNLPNEGWNVSVLTVTEEYVESYDPSEYLSVLPNCHIVRVKPWCSPNDIVLGAKRVLGRLARKGGGGGERTPIEVTPDRRQSRLTFFQRLTNSLRIFVSSMVSIPDLKNGWILPAYFRAKRLMSEQHFDIILTTGPPHSVHVVGLLLRRRFPGIRWIADFRDPWEGGRDKSAATSTKFSRSIETSLMRSVCSTADTILVVTEQSGVLMNSLNRKKPSPKFHILQNGFDNEFLDYQPARHESNGKLKLAHLGTLYHNRSPENFLVALKQFISENQVTPSDISVRILGHCNKYNGKSIKAMCMEQSLEGFVSLEEPVPHKEALQIMLDSDVLLIFAQGQYPCIPGKLYECLAARKPVLALCEQDSETGILINRLSAGIVADPYDVTSIKRAIAEVYVANRNGSLRNKFLDIDLSEFRGDMQAKAFTKIASELLGLK